MEHRNRFKTAFHWLHPTETFMRDTSKKCFHFASFHFILQ